MRVGLFLVAAGSAALLLTNCGGGSTVLATTPTPDEASSITRIAPPDGKLPIPNLSATWTPAMIGGKQGEMLNAAIADRGAVMMVLGRNLSGAAWEDRIFQMIKAASEKTSVVARKRGTLDKLLLERGEIPYRRTLEATGVDVLGRPYYLPKDHMLNTEWLSRKKALKGADTLMTVRGLKVDDQKLKELRKRRRGGCDKLEAALAGASYEATTFFEPFMSWADEELQGAFERHLRKAVPFWRQEISSALNRGDPGGDEAGCLNAYRNYLDEFAPCMEGSCDARPKVGLATDGVVIGMDMASQNLVPDRCPSGLIRNYVNEISDLASRAVEEVLPGLGGDWTAELLRYNALKKIERGMKDFCAPSHRRISTNDLTSAREQLRVLASDLRENTPSGEWISATGQDRIPGVGPVEILAQIRAKGVDPEEDAARFVARLRDFNRCTQGDERLLQVALVDVGSSEVVFMGIFFEEQLVCEDMPPGTP